jgi:hypothetical protein
VKEGISQMSRANNSEKGLLTGLGDAFCPAANRGSDEFFKISDVIPGYSYVNVSVMKSFRSRIYRSRDDVQGKSENRQNGQPFVQSGYHQ